MTIPQLSILVSLIVLAIKLFAAILTGSLALWSDAIESIVNILTAVMTLVAVKISAKPADRNHPYGHQKVEYFAAFFQGLFIVGAALSIFFVAFKGIFTPPQLALNGWALSINMLAALINGLWGWRLVKAGREAHSPALIADGKHLFSDVVSSLAVFMGVILAYALNMPIFDPIIALLMAGFIFISGFQIILTSMGGLMDEAGSKDETLAILNIINANKGEAIEAHDLRHRRAASQVFIEFHLVVNGDMSVRQSHALCDKLEAALREKHKTASITIHVEPEEKKKG